MKATTLLEKQHRKAKAALKKLTKSYDAAALDELASELAAHMVIEETLFYPAVRKVKPDLVAESYEEHAIAQLALRRLLRTPGRDPRFTARATALYDLLEREVVPRFYDRNPAGIPRRWLAMVKHAMLTITPRFSARRMLRDYVDRAYAPAIRPPLGR